jgi:hypothetical protein
VAAPTVDPTANPRRGVTTACADAGAATLRSLPRHRDRAALAGSRLVPAPVTHADCRR